MKKDFFEKTENRIRIEKLAEVFSQYFNEKITKKEIVEYLLQFERLMPDMPDCDLIFESVLETLEQVDFWTWDRIRNETNKLLNRILKGCQGKTAICTLGNEQDSSFRLQREINPDTDKKYKIGQLENILREDGAGFNLIFIDDGAYSGNQVISIFQEWMGIPAAKRKLAKNHVCELSFKEKEKLRNSNIYLGFINFCEETQKYIISELNALGIKNIKINYIYKFEKVFDKGTFKNDIIKDTARRCFEKAGRSIMLATHTVQTCNENELEWTFEKLNHASLGYNDAQQVIVYVYNTPTYSLTALWNDSDTEEFSWKPLFLRKKSYITDTAQSHLTKRI